MIFLILMHSGKGGGLSDMFGGSVGAGGRRVRRSVERNLDRITVTVAVIFALTSLTWISGCSEPPGTPPHRAASGGDGSALVEPDGRC